VVPRELVANAGRQAQDPLPHGHVGEDGIDEVRGPLGHAAAAAPRTDPSLARERDEPIQAAGGPAEPCEPAGQPSTAQELAKLLFDEPRQTLAAAQAAGLRAEGLEMIVHDLAERALCGTARLVRNGRPGHATS
jgi:hypothetical protein